MTDMRLRPSSRSGSSGWEAPAAASFFSSTKLCKGAWTDSAGHCTTQASNTNDSSREQRGISCSAQACPIRPRTFAAASWARARCCGLPTTLAGMRRYGLRGLCRSSKWPSANLPNKLDGLRVTAQQQPHKPSSKLGTVACSCGCARARLKQAMAPTSTATWRPTWPSADGAVRHQWPPRSPGAVPQPPCRQLATARVMSTRLNVHA